MFVYLQKLCIVQLYIHTRQIHRFHRVHEICNQSDLAILKIYVTIMFQLVKNNNNCCVLFFRCYIYNASILQLQWTHNDFF